MNFRDSLRLRERVTSFKTAALSLTAKYAYIY
jgi:hypothetical protein